MNSGLGHSNEELKMPMPDDILRMKPQQMPFSLPMTKDRCGGQSSLMEPTDKFSRHYQL